MSASSLDVIYLLSLVFKWKVTNDIFLSLNINKSIMAAFTMEVNTLRKKNTEQQQKTFESIVLYLFYFIARTI